MLPLTPSSSRSGKQEELGNKSCLPSGIACLRQIHLCHRDAGPVGLAQGLQSWKTCQTLNLLVRGSGGCQHYVPLGHQIHGQVGMAA